MIQTHTHAHTHMHIPHAPVDNYRCKSITPTQLGGLNMNYLYRRIIMYTEIYIIYREREIELERERERDIERERER